MAQSQAPQPEEIAMLQSWLDFFLGLPIWLQTLLCSFVFVAVQVEVVRRVFIKDMQPKEMRVKYIWGISWIIGVIGGILGAILIDGMSAAYWVFTGGTAGPASNALHHFMFKILPSWVPSRRSNPQPKVIGRDEIMEMPKKEGHKKGDTKFLYGFNEDDLDD